MKIGNDSVPSNDSGRYFGTDGFRGEPNVSLTPHHAFRIGRYLGWHYGKEIQQNKPRILIGKDTRRSSYMLEYAIASGITASGADAYLMHVTTTPSVSYICRERSFSCGIMITASHNPFCDNGIKIVNERGEKLDDTAVSLIEDYLDEAFEIPLATRDNIGIIYDYSKGRDLYAERLISLVNEPLNDLRIGLDCANGSSYMIAEKVFSALDAKTYMIGNAPDGKNINEECGSTHIERLIDLVKRENLDAGFAFDGDADRCIAVDSCGEIVDGDKIIYILAKRFKQRNMLSNGRIAVTVMSNMGLINALKRCGIEASVTAVGDKYVFQRMLEEGSCLGGEQSGHIIMLPYASTGDGILTALVLADEMVATGSTLSRLCCDVKLYPQVTVNLKVQNKNLAVNDIEIKEKVAALNEKLNPDGRVLIRASGTEDVVRLSVEATDADLCKDCVNEIKKILQERGHLI